MTPGEVVQALLRRATRAEAPVVEALALAAGYLWRCGSKRCARVNGDASVMCQACGQARPGKP